MQEYLQAISKIPQLTEDQESALCEKIVRGDMAARQRMIEANLKLVVSIANKVNRKSPPSAGGLLEDIVSEGNIGVIHATETFDGNRFQTRFSTYATYWIRQHMTQFLRRNGLPIRLTMAAHNKTRRWDKEVSRLTEVLGIIPSDGEVARSLGFTNEQVGMVRQLKLARGILHESELEGDWETHHLRTTEYSELPYEERELLDRVNMFIEDMTSQERLIINMRFGLNGYEALRLRDIGEHLGVSHEWVRKVETRVLESLKVIGSAHHETD